MNSINWPAPNIWVFIAQLVEHCSANAEAMGSNPVGALKYFSGLNLQLPKLRLQLRWSNLHFICISAVHIIFILYNTSLLTLVGGRTKKVEQSSSLLSALTKKHRESKGFIRTASDNRQLKLLSNFFSIRVFSS